MMYFWECITLLAVFAIVANCTTSGQEKEINANVSGISKYESNLVVYFLEQLYTMRSKVQQLEKGEKEMKSALTSCERRIKVLETRKETRCESGTIQNHGFKPTAKWPHSRRIDFNSPFDKTPSLTYGLYALDSSNKANLRVNTGISGLSRTGFQLSLYTWADTELFGAFVSWMACGK